MKKMVPEGDQVSRNDQGVWRIKSFSLPEKNQAGIPLFHNDPVHLFMEKPGMGIFMNRGFQGYGHLLGAVKTGMTGSCAGTSRRGCSRFLRFPLV